MNLPLLALTIFFLLLNASAARKKCGKSVTTVSGSFAPAKVCSGELIFNETFDEFNLKRWTHERTLAGGGVSNLVTIIVLIIVGIN